jgi:uncharacterized protein
MPCSKGSDSIPAQLAGVSNTDERSRIELEAAAFRGLVAHLQRRTDVQNIDLMNLAGFCRNCLSKWYLAAAEERGIALNYDAARAVVYGMPFEEWKANYQQKATAEQLQKFEETTALHAVVSGHHSKS